MQKKIMIIGGGKWQAPIIQKAQDMGYFVICSNKYSNTLGSIIANKFYEADVLDFHKNLSIAENENICGVLTDQTDISVPTVAYISKSLSLPGISVESSQLFTNKYLMREFLRMNDFPCPRYKYINSSAQAFDFYDKRQATVVLKPISSQSSRGISIVHSRVEILKAYETAITNSPTKYILIEDYIGGMEFTVEGIKLPFQNHMCLTYSRKQHFSEVNTVAQSLFFFNKTSLFDISRLETQHNKLIESMGLEMGLTHAEYKYSNGEFYLIEVAARGGGSLISSDIVPMMTNVDTNQLLIKMSTGEDSIAVTGYINKDINACLHFFNFKSGFISSVNGVEKAKSVEGVHCVDIEVENNQYIESVVDDRSRHGFVILKGNSFSIIENKLKEIEHYIKPVYAKESMENPGFPRDNGAVIAGQD